MKFDGFSTAHLGEEVVALSFKLEFPYSNNTAEYEVYLTGLATALKMGIKHLKVIGDSNMVVCQAKGSFSLKEPSLALYKTLPENGRKVFDVWDRAYENWYTNALATLGSQIAFEGSSTRVKVSKSRESIVEIL